jgi:hypothetical protein
MEMTLMSFALLQYEDKITLVLSTNFSEQFFLSNSKFGIAGLFRVIVTCIRFVVILVTLERARNFG